MTLQSNGAISLAQIGGEFHGVAPFSFNQYYGVAGGIPLSGVISASQFYGKTSLFAATISTSQKELNLATWAAANGWDGIVDVQITIASNVYIWSGNTSIAALTTGVFPKQLTIINNGYISGKGGTGGYYATNGLAGGDAISLGMNTTFNTGTGYIGGGGGGGGGASNASSGNGGGGGGAGGGDGGIGGSAAGLGGAIYYGGSNSPLTAGNSYGAGGQAGGAGGSMGSYSYTYTTTSPKGGTQTYTGTAYVTAGGGGGGMVFPGAAQPGQATSWTGGQGGGGGQAGLAGGSSTGAGGGGWGAAGGANATYLGGAAGKAVALNSKVLTIVGGQTKIYGAIA